MNKPGDFFIGVLDFFAVLLPGMVATWILNQYLPSSVRLDLTQAADHVVTGAALLLSSYVLGNFVFMIGSQLDSSYDRWRRRTKPSSSDHAFNAAKQLTNDLTPHLVGGNFTTLQWAKSYIQIHNPAARVDIDRLEAHEKFFRSFVVISIVLTAHFLLHEQALFLAIGTATLGALSYKRFKDQRWKATELTYGTAVILHATNGESAGKKDAGHEPKVEE